VLGFELLAGCRRHRRTVLGRLVANMAVKLQKRHQRPTRSRVSNYSGASLPTRSPRCRGAAGGGVTAPIA
jgi:hypothetical protein